MRALRPWPAAALLIVLIHSSLAGAQELRQSVNIDTSEEAWIRGLREDASANAANWMQLPRWGLAFRSDAELGVLIGNGFGLSVTPRVSWRELEGASGSGSGYEAWTAKESSTKDAAIELHRAEASLALPELGLLLSFGKMRPQFGSGYIEPFSVLNPRGRDEYEKGLWMGGASLAWRDLGIEAYCEAKEDPLVLASLSALLGLHELGFLYRYDGGSELGAWYRSQLGEDIIPYAEFLIREKSSFLDIEGLSTRSLPWNCDALAGLGYTPPGMNISAYVEYRFRRGGYDERDWEGLRENLRTAGRSGEAALLAGLPYLQTAVHSLGFYAKSAREIAGIFSWSLFAAYLYPDGIYASLGASARIIPQFSLELASSLAGALGEDSEMAYWPTTWRCSLRARWEIKARE